MISFRIQAPDEIEDEICSEEHLAKDKFLAKVEFLANNLR